MATRPLDNEFQPTAENAALLQYVQVLVAAAGDGSFQEVNWLLQTTPTCPEAHKKEAHFAALFAAVAGGLHAVCEGLLQMLNIRKQTLALPKCSAVKKGSSDPYSSKVCEEVTSLLAPAYVWTGVTPIFADRTMPLATQRCRYLGMMQLLLKYGVKPVSAVGCLLEETADNVDILAVKMLLEHGVDINAQTSDGSTLLHLLGGIESDPHRSAPLAVEPFVRMLLTAGAKPVTRNNKQETAIDVCAKGGKLRAIMQDALAS